MLTLLGAFVLAHVATAAPSKAREEIDAVNFSELSLVEAVFQETNRQRAQFGLRAFLPDEKAARAARQHAKWMAGTHQLSHDQPVGQGTPLAPLDRLVQQGLRPHLASENIAYNLLPDITPGRLFYTRLENGRPVYSYQSYGPTIKAHTYESFARAIVAQWMHSPPHRAHIVDPELRYLGVGCALSHRRKHPDTIYVTQDFYTPHDSPGDSSGTTLIPPRGAAFQTDR